MNKTQLTSGIKTGSLWKILTLAILIAFSGCSKQELANSGPSNGNAQVSKAEDPKVIEARKKLFNLVKENKIRFDIASESSDAKRSSTNKINNFRKNSDYNHYNEFVSRAINSEDHECGPTMIDEYIMNSVSDWGEDEFNMYFGFSFMVFDYAYILQNSNEEHDTYYGSEGQFDNAINRTFDDLTRFWGISYDILLTDAHGSFFADNSKVIELLNIYQDLGMLDPSLTDDDLANIAEWIEIAFGSDKFDDYKHPLLTFNAFASTPDPWFPGTVYKIVMGEGILDTYGDLGYGDVAPQSILAHEYAHQVQFANNVVFNWSPEGTRRTELMADAMASYYLTHKMGLAMNWKRVQQFLGVFYSIGDCQFDNDGHHGTPNQRLRASLWGYDLAMETQKKGKILKASDFVVLFDAALADLVAPDNF